MFEELKSDEKIKDVIKSAFDVDMNVSGGWGHNSEDATIIEDTSGVPLQQLEFTLVSMRANIQMNMLLSDEDRYSGINPSEESRELTNKDGKTLEKVIYKISAMKELDYKILIDEYKENHGKDDFDIAEHFKKRSECTIEVLQDYWFDITSIQ